MASQWGPIVIRTSLSDNLFTYALESEELLLFPEDLVALELFASGTMENIALSMNAIVPEAERFTMTSNSDRDFDEVKQRAAYLPLQLGFSVQNPPGVALGQNLAGVAPLYLQCLFRTGYRQEAIAGLAEVSFNVSDYGDVQGATVRSTDLCEGRPTCPATTCLETVLNGWRTSWRPVKTTSMTAGARVSRDGPLIEMKFR